MAWLSLVACGGGTSSAGDGGDGDARVDAAIVDASARDADPVDAVAPDALPLDAEAPDALPLDALAPDADPLDAEAPDALPPDALAPDADPLDAVAPDADPLDAAAPDAAAADADPLDLGFADAIAPDADPLDAGVVDALAPAADAAAPDAFSYDAYVPDLGLPASGTLPPIRFGPLLTIQWPIQLVSGAGGDFDGNGRTDAIASTATRTFVWFNDPTGWSRVEVLAETADLLHPVDMDLDGDADLVARVQGTTQWIENTGRATRPWIVHPITGAAPVALDVADVTGDGLPDVAVAGAVGTGAHLYARDAAGAWIDHLVAAGTYTAIALADANLDGVRDVSAVTSTPCAPPFGGACVTVATTFVTRGPGGLGFAPGGFPSNTGPYQGFLESLALIRQPRLGQADTDPEPELFWAAELGGGSLSQIHVLVMDATPTGWAMDSTMAYTDSSGTIGALAVGNFDTDLQSELIWEGIGLFEGNATSLSGHAGVGGSFRGNGWGWPNAPVRRYHPADLDLDGLPDILVICDRGVFWLRYLP